MSSLEGNRATGTSGRTPEMHNYMRIYCGLLSFSVSRRPGAALLENHRVLVAIVMTSMRFAEFSRLALWLMTPYAAWVFYYASYLNFGIWRLNKGPA
ncbi:MAG TPA: TspO/MBR family protein [Terriglobales bacterium]|nr:TspO/MBR family protein [Terriglobales bacterium]